jgi:hypothetical protein
MLYFTRFQTNRCVVCFVKKSRIRRTKSGNYERFAGNGECKAETRKVLHKVSNDVKKRTGRRLSLVFQVLGFKRCLSVVFPRGARSCRRLIHLKDLCGGRVLGLVAEQCRLC